MPRSSCWGTREQRARPPRWPWPQRRSLAGCGSAAPAASGPAAEAPPGGAPFLATSLATAAGTWAVVVMGGSVATAEQLLAAVRAPGREHHVEAGHPARHRRQRRPGPGRRRRAVADHRVPAQPVPDLHAADPHPRRRPGLVLGRPAGCRAGRRSRRARRRARYRRPARPDHRRHRRAGRARLHQLDDPGHAAVPRRDAGRPSLRAARPHRRRVHPARDTHARRHLQ